MFFKDRMEAGKKLASLMKQYHQNPDAVVLGLARGGVVVAYALAEILELALDVLCVRKIGAPNNPELAIGAITSSGDCFYNEDLIAYLGVSKDYIRRAEESEKKLAEQREKFYRKDREKIPLKGKIAIIVDDGLATGATMHAAIESVRKNNASRIIVAVPVSAPDTYQKIKVQVDEVVCLEKPYEFQAVGQFYQEFFQVEDDEVMDLLHKAKMKKKS